MAGTTTAFTTEFHRQFQADTARLLRRRFLWFTAVVAGLSLLSMAIGLAVALVGGVESLIDAFASAFGGRTQALTYLAIVIPWIAMYVGAFVWAIKLRPGAADMLRASLWLVAADGIFNVLARAAGLDRSAGLEMFMISHILACLFIPWTPQQAVRPVLLVVLFSAAVHSLFEQPFWRWTPDTIPFILIGLALTPVAGLPGTFICWFRHSRRMQRFKIDFLQSRYGEVRRELVDAQRIHESLFPGRIEHGPLRLAYTYEPARAIGGDFLYARQLPAPPDASDRALAIVLIDVTGHGIPAALTVNRLYGELDRVFAENPAVGPGEVLALLNRYVHLTLAGHSIYATALCVRVDPDRAELRYASGGHPTAFLRAVDGTVEELASTSLVLGACPADDFHPAEAAVRFGPGDSLVAYTDGAIEARDADGRMIRIDGMRRIIAGSSPERQGQWPDLVRAHVQAHRPGPPEDDTLIVEVFRTLPDDPTPRPDEPDLRAGERVGDHALAPKSAPVRAAARV